jgi:hypothetical protein
MSIIFYLWGSCFSLIQLEVLIQRVAEAYYANCPTITGVKDITISNESELTELLNDVSATDINGNKLEVSCIVEEARTKL